MKKVLMVLFSFMLIISFTGCNKTENKDNSSFQSISDFEAEVKKVVVIKEETVLVASAFNAKDGLKLVTENEKILEIYSFDKNSAAYKKAEKNQKLTLEGFGEFDAIVKNGYAIAIEEDFPKYQEILNIFNKLG